MHDASSLRADDLQALDAVGAGGDRAHGVRAQERFSCIALSLNTWFGQWVNRQYLLTRLGRINRVVYSNGAWTIWDRATEAWKSASAFGRTTAVDNVVVEEAPRWLMRWPRHRWIENTVLALHARRLRRIAAAGRGTRTVAVLFHPSFYPYLRFLRADVVVYHAYDLFADTPGWNPRLQSMEDALVRDAQLVTAVTPAIATALSSRVQRDIRILPNGVDLDLFSQFVATGAPVPQDLDVIPRPRIGYVGSLHPQVDFGLIAELAARRPAWQFVFVGGRIAQPHERAERELNACRALPNVHFLGSKEHREVPGYTMNMDVNIMCYRLSEGAWVTSGYPLKLHEYLAAGAPIIGANLASVRAFSPLVVIADGADSWESAIDQAIAETSEERRTARRAVAAQNGWDERARQLAAWLSEAAGSRHAAGDH